MAYTIGAIVRSDLWGRFFDFRPRGWWKTRERAHHANSRHPSPSNQEIQLNYRKGSGLKVDCRFIYGDCEESGVCFATPPTVFSKG